MEVPEVVKEKYSTYWWMYFFLVILAGVTSFVALEIYGGLILMIISTVVWCMVRDNCQNMSQPCVMMLGLMCMFEFTWLLIPLFSQINGRSTSTTARHPQEGNKQVIVTTVETHPFFDETQGWRYNMQSWLLIITPLIVLIGSVLCYYTYQAFPSALFDNLNEGGSGSALGNSGFGGYGGTAPPRMPPSGGHVLGSGNGGGRPAGRQGGPPALFQGSGQRLGGTS